jgi:hypothetical protein
MQPITYEPDGLVALLAIFLARVLGYECGAPVQPKRQSEG